MSDLTAKFAELEEQLEAQNASVMAKLTSIESKLAESTATLDTLNNNGAVNTRYLLAALGALDPCKECPQPSLTVPPVITTPFPPTDDKCLRVQALLHAIHASAAKFDILNNLGIGFSPTLLSTAYNEIILSIGEPSTIPLPSWAEMASMGAYAITYVSLNVLVGTSLSEYLSPMLDDLRDAIYLTGTPAEGKGAYDSYISSSAVPTGANQLLRSLGYNELFSYYLDPANEVNLDGYDSAACSAPAGCFTLMEDYTFSIEKTRDDGLNYVTFPIPSWAGSVQWNVTFPAGFNVFWADTRPVDGDAFGPFLDSAGFSGNGADTWNNCLEHETWFGVGGFFSGFPNGTTYEITINSLIACPCEEE